MLIFGVVFATIMGVLIQVSYSAADNMTRASQVRNAELGLMQIDRQVRSGNVILDPDEEKFEDSGVISGNSLRVFTQTDGVHKCVQWRIRIGDESRGKLEYRSWDPDWDIFDAEVSDWSVVAHDLVASPNGKPAFTKANEYSWSQNGETSSINVEIFVQAENTRSAPTAVRTTLTGRNTVYGYPVGRCDSIPAP